MNVLLHSTQHSFWNAYVYYQVTEDQIIVALPFAKRSLEIDFQGSGSGSILPSKSRFFFSFDSTIVSTLAFGS